MLKERRRDILVVSSLLLLAIGFRRYGLEWGLPEVYEEATPLRKAWDMWGWDRDGGVDLNPHFFNYPSLVIYLHFLLQGLQFSVFKLVGVIDSRLDYTTMYLVDRTPIFLAGRWLSLLFGAGTVLVVHRIGLQLSSRIGALLAAALLAVHTYHIDQSQQITVDVPLTFWTLTGLWCCLRVLARPSRAAYLIAGVVLGLATATKYTGALLVVLLVASHLLARNQARRDGKDAPRWSWLILAGAVSGAVFILASPYVILDFAAFRDHVATERTHMQLGHFGLDDTPAWRYYLERLGSTLVGWPVLLAALVGVLLPRSKPARAATWLLILYVLVFVAPLLTWEMKADRYLLPVLPAFLLLAGLSVASLLERIRFGRWTHGLRMATTVLLFGVLISGTARELPELWSRADQDTRTRARQWIEHHLPQGASIVTEAYGPDLLHPTALMHLPAPVTDRILADDESHRVFAVQTLPMFQTRPERSAAYYRLELYPDADYLISSSSVRSRYQQEPRLFSAQNDFYRQLDARWKVLAEFVPDGGPGPHLTLYENPRRQGHFGSRDRVAGPTRIEPATDGLRRDEGYYYLTMGNNYMVFGHLEEALESYQMGLDFQPERPEILKNLIVGTTWVLLDLGRTEQARGFLDACSGEDLPALVTHAISELRRGLATHGPAD